MKIWWMMIAVVVTMTGCATITRDQCSNLNPRSQGYADGQKGRTTEAMDKTMRTCQSGDRMGSIQDVSVFKNEYLKAYQEGLKQYCTPENGERVGLLGEDYYGVCPKEVEAPFLKEYLYALKIYRDAHPEPDYYYGSPRYNPFFWPYNPYWRGPYPYGWW